MSLTFVCVYTSVCCMRTRNRLRPCGPMCTRICLSVFHMHLMSALCLTHLARVLVSVSQYAMYMHNTRVVCFCALAAHCKQRGEVCMGCCGYHLPLDYCQAVACSMHRTYPRRVSSWLPSGWHLSSQATATGIITSMCGLHPPAAEHLSLTWCSHGLSTSSAVTNN